MHFLFLKAIGHALLKVGETIVRIILTPLGAFGGN